MSRSRVLFGTVSLTFVFLSGYAAGQRQPPTTTVGQSEEALRSLDLTNELQSVEGRRLRMRKITLQPGGDRTLTFPSSDRQHDLGSLHLKPRQGTMVSGGMQSRLIPPSNNQFFWSAPAHEVISHAVKDQPAA